MRTAETEKSAPVPYRSPRGRSRSRATPHPPLVGESMDLARPVDAAREWADPRRGFGRGSAVGTAIGTHCATGGSPTGVEHCAPRRLRDRVPEGDVERCPSTRTSEAVPPR